MVLKENELRNFSDLTPAVKLSEVFCLRAMNGQLILQRYLDEKKKQLLKKLCTGNVS